MHEKKSICLWRGENVNEYKVSPEIRRLLGQNFLYHLLRFDPSSFYLVIETLEDKQYSYDELKKKLEGYLPNESPDVVENEVSKSIDTLLDSGVFKAEWVDEDNRIRRLFSNRGELLDRFGEIRQKSSVTLLNGNFISNLKDVYKLLFDETVSELDIRLKEIERNLITFINKVVRRAKEEKGCDVIVPIMRKGYILFKFLKDKGKIDLCGLTESDVFSLRLGKIKNKNPLIFDDACNKGITIRKILEDLKSLEMQNYAIATYCINKDFVYPRIREKINYIGYEYNDYEFDREVLNIILYISSLGEISDYDHLFIRCELEKPLQPSIIYRTLQRLQKLGIGEIIEPNLDHLHPNHKKITLNRINYLKICDEMGFKIPRNIITFDTEKIRITFEREDDPENTYLVRKFVVVPILNPVMRKPLEDYENCGVDGLKVCTLIEKEEFIEIRDKIPPHPCVDCIVYNLVKNVAQYFFKVFAHMLWEEAKTKFQIRDLAFEYMERKYEEFSKRLIELKNSLTSIY